MLGRLNVFTVLALMGNFQIKSPNTISESMQETFDARLILCSVISTIELVIHDGVEERIDGLIKELKKERTDINLLLVVLASKIDKLESRVHGHPGPRMRWSLCLPRMRRWLCPAEPGKP